MKAVVLDASAAVAFVHPTQSTDATRALAASSDAYEYVAPYIFDWEVRNALLVLSRRSGSRTDVDECLTLLAKLNIHVVDPLPRHLVAALGHIARQTGLSLFDASYFALAAARSWILASRDARLLQVCSEQAVTVMDLR